MSTDKASLTAEYQTLQSQQQQLESQYNQVVEGMRSGEIDGATAANLRADIRDRYENNNTRLRQIGSGIDQLRTKEVDDLRAEIPEWESDDGFRSGTRKLAKFALDQGMKSGWLQTASAAEVRAMEELRQMKQHPGRTPSPTLKKLARDKNGKFVAQDDRSALASRLGITEHAASKLSAKQAKRMNMEFNIKPGRHK